MLYKLNGLGQNMGSRSIFALSFISDTPYNYLISKVFSLKFESNLPIKFLIDNLTRIKNFGSIFKIFYISKFYKILLWMQFYRYFQNLLYFIENIKQSEISGNLSL